MCSSISEQDAVTKDMLIPTKKITAIVKFSSLTWTLVSQNASNANSEVGIIQLHLILLSFFRLGSTDAPAGAELCLSTGSVPEPLKNSNGQIVQVPAQPGQQISPGHRSWQLPLNSAWGHLITTAYQGISQRKTNVARGKRCSLGAGTACFCLCPFLL